MFLNRFLLAVISTLIFNICSAQKLIISGPMQGYTEYRTAQIWVSVSRHAEAVHIEYWNTKDSVSDIAIYKQPLGNEVNPISIELTNLQPNTVYEYVVIANRFNGKPSQSVKGRFKTMEIKGYKEAPDFSFITGSCAFFPDDMNSDYAKKHIGDQKIFTTMSTTGADFMLWLGDNWYTLAQDYHSAWGLADRARRVRATEELQPLLSSMPNYAIWDDHDYGPNNAGSSYILKEETREVFKNYWCNPTYGENDKGIYTMLQYHDVSFIMLDDRTWRSSDNMKDSVGGKPNPEKVMFGPQQMRWLKDVLLQSNSSSFKIITTGSQMLNTYSPYDCFYHFPIEFKELIDFIADNDIEGVVFLTGDRHHSEVLKYKRNGKYPLYEMTVSPLTSRLYDAGGVEKGMPIRIKKVEGIHNFGKVSITGAYGNRQLKLSYYDKEGNELDSWVVNQKELKD